MTTENRSSNTEMAAKLSPCPFCGQHDAFVEQLDSDASVVICQGRIDEYSACLARGPVGVQQHEDEVQPGRDQAVKEWNKRAAAVPHPEPIAWMVGTALVDQRRGREGCGRDEPTSDWLGPNDRYRRDTAAARSAEVLRRPGPLR
ncbi:Lar family restriction alleviation protein [Pseudomonas sp. NPDC086566]|uniref:Lar family restriction alleviation protein n=1 Tax=Pseudomonas sp. NPDC086566 TaxID=3390647 RepID=UPI003D00B600